jgi:GT2 family glycosyltransferase
MFYDDNQNSASALLLYEAALPGDVKIISGQAKDAQYYVDETTHYWNDTLVLRVASMKNEIISYAAENGFDYLFLIDSDILVDKNLLMHLKEQNKDILSEIFWTVWQPGTLPMPNAWLFDMYEMAHPRLDDETKWAKTVEFMEGLKVPGVYEVGGLGACTLISAKALKAGVNFSPLKNVSFWGEDRWFCVRAAAMGFELFVDTFYPATHLYRESDIPKQASE